MGESVKLANGKPIDTEGIWDNTQGKLQSEINAGLSRSLCSNGILESYNFPISAADTSASPSYTVQNDGFAFLRYTFSESTYSQFSLIINGQWMFGRNIMSGNASMEGFTGVISFPVRKGDTIRVGFYGSNTMLAIYLQVV